MIRYEYSSTSRLQDTHRRYVRVILFSFFIPAFGWIFILSVTPHRSFTSLRDFVLQGLTDSLENPNTLTRPRFNRFQNPFPPASPRGPLSFRPYLALSLSPGSRLPAGTRPAPPLANLSYLLLVLPIHTVPGRWERECDPGMPLTAPSFHIPRTPGTHMSFPSTTRTAHHTRYRHLRGGERNRQAEHRLRLLSGHTAITFNRRKTWEVGGGPRPSTEDPCRVW
ncbi:hypothetical protein M430DRAFT_153982 [Amorphotheca resinae ATCC 22711]|jgi:hypothetical protein|uniref:Uncharacterized protein n=1 Tax=Amorphotheca resinae ATCC 22711 TaxID=857342 RepID=A0A2T3BDD4_AMORE|nr:hypothetical protein M430DRAFT_153982 [Amorphotheca resinae ATCC 22711]PSS27420.1 hypothetical protein M430DRAFT_153982 [Amorphotheca resinae ATCC 22711]